MSARRFAILDPAAGMSGDMLLGALIDAGAPPAWLRGLPGRLGLPAVEVKVAEVMRCGLRATKVDVLVDGAIEPPGDVSHDDHDRGPEHHDHHHHSHGVDHHHDHGGQPHRHVGELLAMIAAADLSAGVKERATAAFRLLADAEGRVHGVAPDNVALHEVGAYDALIDIVGAFEGFEQLGITEVAIRPVALGTGWVRAAHGVMAVPTPATAILLEGVAVAPNGPVKGEATTPTGAALLRILETGFEPTGTWRAVRTGFGAGGRNPDHYANTLRLVVAEAAKENADEMTVVATDLDDFSPEYLEPLREALTGAGAVDVLTWPTQMKKGRIGFRVEALTPPDRVDSVTRAFFVHSTTAGVRRWTTSRSVLQRESWITTTDAGDPVRVKTVHGPDGPRVKPEYDDVADLARRTGQPAHQLFRTIQEEALRVARSVEPAGDPLLVIFKESTR